MEKLIPVDDYFKSTTRRHSSDASKLKLILAAHKGVDALLESLGAIKLTSPAIKDAGVALATLRRRNDLLSRCVILVKGSTQPRHLYRHRRVRDINRVAGEICSETGAEFSVVKRVLLDQLSEFVDPDTY